MRNFRFRTSDGYLGSADTYVEAPESNEARLKAEEWIRGFDYGDVDETFWIDVYIHEFNADEYCEKLTVPIHPDEPKCTGDTHAWVSPHCIFGGLDCNPGVFGNGGGVLIKELCSNCGRYRTTDTWAQRADTGEQGLRSIRYRESDDDSETWIMSNSED